MHDFLLANTKIGELCVVTVYKIVYTYRIMATTANILTLLKYYTSKQKSPMVEFTEFTEYIRRYAQHHMNENSDLVVYCGNSYVENVNEEIQKLVTEHQVVMGSVGNKDCIFVVPYLVEQYACVYQNIESNCTIPFPNFIDLPKNTPHSVVTQVPAADIIYRLLDKPDLNDKNLYCIVFTKGVPSVLFPSSVNMRVLVDAALHKLQHLLQKEESHDYFLKKLTVSNPGKEISIKSFFSQFVARPEDALEVIKNTGETFYYWSQLFYFIKQDYNKLKDFTPEDINILQSVAVAEIATSYYKSRAAEKQQKDEAFECLDRLLKNPPYYFNMSDIVKMKDPTGVPLLGQYMEDELHNHLEKLSSESANNELPDLLIFKINDDDGYFIYKDKVMPLLIRLCNDARILIRESLVKLWYSYLLNYDSLPEMRESPAFERCLERELKNCEPVLYALLNSPFLSVIAFDDKTPGRVTLFRDGVLVPYSELLMISRAEILSDAKIKLPFWYSIPVFSWLLSLLFRKPKKKNKKNKNKTPQAATSIVMEEQKAKEAETVKKLDDSDKGDPKLSRKRELRKAAGVAEKQLVPENSSLDRELEGYLNEWNDRIGKKNHDNLTEDMNNLIRDYLRKTLRTLKTEPLTLERINSLSDALVDSPSMTKIKNHPALKRYVALYIIKLVKNLP